MPGLPWLIFQGALKMTVKGAAMTLTSTVASCTLACYIEIGAHRVVYRFFPHKYANVTNANGLSQEQLDAVRVHNVDQMLRWSDDEEPQVMGEQGTLRDDSHEPTKHVPLEDATSFNTGIPMQLRDSPHSFWKEERREESNQLTSIPFLALGQQVFSTNDILACSMTC